MILFCTLCERLVDVSGMTCVKDSRGGGRNHSRGRATYLDRKAGLVHVVLSEQASKKFQPVLKEEVPAAPAQPVEAEAPAACEAGIAELLRDREFATIVPSIASKREIISFCQRYTGLPGAVPSLFTMREAKKHNYAAFQTTFEGVMKSISSQREEIIFEIVVLLASGGNMSEADIANEKARLSNGWTLEALRRRKTQIETAQRLAGIGRKLGVEGMKVERAELRGDNMPQVAALLPERYTAQELKRIARESYPEFKKLVRDFGGQVTSRLQGR